jgi:hypothetical protein
MLMVDVAPLAKTLRPMGLTLSPWPDAPHGKHPVCLDLWRVRGGQLKLATVDQHVWAASTGAALGAAIGTYRRVALEALSGALRAARHSATSGLEPNPLWRWSRASAGWLTGAVQGLESAARQGFLPEADLGASAARGWSEAVSRVVASYHEVIAIVPNTIRGGHDARLYAYVLGMTTDGAMSLLGDRMMACGYRKTPSLISRKGFANYVVAAASQRKVLRMTARDPHAEAWARVDRRLDAYRAVFVQPLLGYLDGGTFAVSSLDRSLDDEGVRWAPTGCHVEIARRFVDGLPPGTYEVKPLSSRTPLGAFHACGVPTAVTFPRHDGRPSGNGSRS